MLTQILLIVAIVQSSSEFSRPPVESGAERQARDVAVRILANALAGEPRIEAVQRAAAARAGPSVEEVDGLRLRSRTAALLPKLSADYRKDNRTYRAVGVSSGQEVDYVRSSPGDTLSVRLTFDLDALIFGREELGAMAAADWTAERRRSAVERATRLFHERLRKRMALAVSPPSTALERAEAELALEEVTAELDALTGLYGRRGR